MQVSFLFHVFQSSPSNQLLPCVPMKLTRDWYKYLFNTIYTRIWYCICISWTQQNFPKSRFSRTSRLLHVDERFPQPTSCCSFPHRWQCRGSCGNLGIRSTRNFPLDRENRVSFHRCDTMIRWYDDTICMQCFTILSEFSHVSPCFSMLFLYFLLP